ncbi:spry domain-containing socs box protein 4 [Plakobranchus ocellatus]|uniref:Spry domain-containing socs box protein 4 n=1 Tax=Plakobranchus ocellatus TaxID=259542 RepID=A0AAV4ALF0_9GAST|nr:spry domain-containing socs box protein 4 [Plakobranchus ocellatus]
MKVTTDLVCSRTKANRVVSNMYCWTRELLPLSNRTTDVRTGFKTQRIAPTLRQVAEFVCALTKERGYFKTCIVGHVNCCLQCGPTLTVIYPTIMCMVSWLRPGLLYMFSWTRATGRGTAVLRVVGSGSTMHVA